MNTQEMGGLMFRVRETAREGFPKIKTLRKDWREGKDVIGLVSVGLLNS